MSLSGEHKTYKREDGTVTLDQRRLTSAQVIDRFFLWAIAGLLTWLCLATMTLQQQVAVLVERTTNQSARVDRNTSDIQGLRITQGELERQFGEIKGRR